MQRPWYTVVARGAEGLLWSHAVVRAQGVPPTGAGARRAAAGLMTAAPEQLPL